MARKRRTPAPVVVTYKPHPVAWREALRLAGGDRRRLVVEEGGSVLVRNARG